MLMLVCVAVLLYMHWYMHSGLECFMYVIRTVCLVCAVRDLFLNGRELYGFENDLPQSIVIADKALHCAYIYYRLVLLL